MNQTVSDEFINAYIDGELGQEEKQWLLEQLSSYPNLAQRVQDLQLVKNALLNSFEINSAKYKKASITRIYQRPAMLAMAAGVFLTLMGFMLGYALSTGKAEKQNLLNLAKKVELQGQTVEKPWRVMLHVSSGNEARMETVLNETRQLLEKYKSSKKKVQIEILTNANGLKMLRKDKSKYAKLIAQMQKDYANLTFSACNIAIEFAKEHELNDSIELLPNVHVVPSAIGEIMKKQHEGWSYIQI